MTCRLVPVRYAPRNPNVYSYFCRVLFERILTGGGLTPQNSMEVWNKFLEFESNIGDLAGVIKVERRRAQVIKK
jgi:hypothetical protein